MVFNVAMTDAELIRLLGGDTAVAKRLGWPTLNGARRVNNWKRRGIPDSIKLKHGWLRKLPKTTPAVLPTEEA